MPGFIEGIVFVVGNLIYETGSKGNWGFIKPLFYIYIYSFYCIFYQINGSFRYIEKHLNGRV